jgi:dihydrolipoamide dehydrogenase
MARFGVEVHVIEMLPDIIMTEEPDARELVRRELSSVMHFHLGYKAKEVRRALGKKVVVAENKEGETIEIKADEIMVATGRAPWKETQFEKTGVRTEHGWVVTDEHLKAGDNIWACGDANGRYLFKHVANYESEIVFYNAFRNADARVDYHAVPHAIFTHPQVAGVGMKEEEARKKHDILVGEYRYENTAMGEAMRLRDYFVKVIVDRDTYQILGATIVGPQASVLIQEIINLMYTREQAGAMYRAMHIHPAMNEVVQRAFYNLREV